MAPLWNKNNVGRFQPGQLWLITWSYYFFASWLQVQLFSWSSASRTGRWAVQAASVHRCVSLRSQISQELRKFSERMAWTTGYQLNTSGWRKTSTSVGLCDCCYPVIFRHSDIEHRHFYEIHHRIFVKQSWINNQPPRFSWFIDVYSL